MQEDITFLSDSQTRNKGPSERSCWSLGYVHRKDELRLGELAEGC